MCGIIDVNIYPFSFGGQQKGLKELDKGKVSFDRGNSEGKC